MPYTRSIFTLCVLLALVALPVEKSLAVPYDMLGAEAASQLTLRSIATQDGWVLESRENSNRGGRLNVGGGAIRVGDDAKDRQFRSILSFNTASLPSNAVIVSATLKLKQKSIHGTNPFTTHGKLLLDIRRPFFGHYPALERVDFQAHASLARAGVVSTTPTNGYYSARLSNAALAYVNKNGLTQLRLRFELDDNDDQNADYLAFYSGNAGTVAFRPVLEIRYSLPPSATPTTDPCAPHTTLTPTPTSCFDCFIPPPVSSFDCPTVTTTVTPTVTSTRTATATIDPCKPEVTPTSCSDCFIPPPVSSFDCQTATPTATSTITPTRTPTSTPTVTLTNDPEILTPTPTATHGCIDC